MIENNQEHSRETRQEGEKFSYRYSAQEQEELKRLRQKYLPPEEDKMAQLRRLDANVTKKGMIASISIGVIGAPVMGIGMCLAMVWENMLIGIPIGILGIVLIAVAYPLYTNITRHERERIAPEILRLTEELMK